MYFNNQLLLSFIKNKILLYFLSLHKAIDLRKTPNKPFSKISKVVFLLGWESGWPEKSSQIARLNMALK
jgi:hypothetical protein